MMRKLLKWLGILTLLGVLALAGVGAYLKAKFPPERVKALVNEQVMKRYSREVDLKSVGFSPLKGLTLNGFKLSEKPDFKAGTFLSGDSLSVSIHWLPLIHRKVSVKSVELTKPDVHVVRSADGRFNFSDLMEGATAPAKSPAAEPSSGVGVSLFMDRLTVRGGTARFVDRSPAAVDVRLEALDLTVKGFSLLTPFNVNVAFKIEGKAGGKPVAGSAACKARVSLLGGGEAKVESLDLGANGTSLRLVGFVKDFSDPAGEVTVTIISFDSASVAPFAALPGYLKDAAATGKLTVKGNLKEAHLQGDVNASASGMRAVVALDADMTAPFADPTFNAQGCKAKLTLRPGPPLPADLGAKGPLSLSFSARGTMNDFTVSVDAEGRDLELSYAGTMNKLPGTDLAFKANAAIKDMKDVRLDSLKAVLGPLVANVSGTVADATGAGRLDLKVTAPPFVLGPLGDMSPLLKDYKLSGKAGLDVSVKGSFSAPQAQGTADLLDVGALPMTGVSLSGANGQVAFSQNGSESHGTVCVSSVTHPRYEGRDFRLDWSLKNAAADMSRADGAATFSAADGKITNLPLASKINALLKRDAADITYRTMGAHFKITKGVLATSDFTVDSAQSDILVKGTVRLVDLMADLRATFKLPAGSLGGSLGEWLQDESGRPVLDVVIKGPLTGKPEVKPIVRRAAINAAKGLLQKYIGPPGSKGGGNSSGEDSSPSPTQQIQKALEKGLGDFFKKKGAGE